MNVLPIQCAWLPISRRVHVRSTIIWVILDSNIAILLVIINNGSRKVENVGKSISKVHNKWSKILHPYIDGVHGVTTIIWIVTASEEFWTACEVGNWFDVLFDRPVNWVRKLHEVGLRIEMSYIRYRWIQEVRRAISLKTKWTAFESPTVCGD